MRPILLLWLSLSGILHAQISALETRTYYADPAATPPERFADYLHLKADLSFVPQEGKVRGKVQLYFKPLRPRLDTLLVEAAGITPQEVLLDGRAVSHRPHVQGFVLVFERPIGWERSYTLSVTYVAQPATGLYFMGWKPAQAGLRKQIWAISAANWLPCVTDGADKLTMEFFITFDKNYRVRANGELKKQTENPDSTITWHYALEKPHSSYLTMLAIGEYAFQTRKSSRGVPMELWYYPDRAHTVETTYRHSTHMMDWLEQELGVNYPWTGYAQVPIQDYMYGAMETTTATVFGDFYLVDSAAFNDRSYVNTNCHELAHQWFGNSLTLISSPHLWLQENFATYYAKKYEQALYGEDFYQFRRHEELMQTLAAGEKDAYPIASSMGGVARWYPKGSLMLDMLRYVVGDEPFRRVITHYLTQHAGGVVHTYDLYRAFYDVMGMPLDWFWEQWILRGGEPHYKVSWQTAAATGTLAVTRVQVAQIQPVNALNGLFRMPVVTQVFYTDGSMDSLRTWVAAQQETLDIPNPQRKEVAFVLFDPGRQVIKRLTFERTFAQLRAQVLRAPHMIDRYDALTAMDKFPLAEKRATLAEIFLRDKHFMIRGEIIRQLASDTQPDGLAILARALQDPDIRVFKAVAQYVTRVPEDLREPYEMLLTAPSYEANAYALRHLCASFPQDKAVFLGRTANRPGWRGQNVRITRLEMMAAQTPEALDTLVQLASPVYEFETRRNALQALQRLNQLPEEVIPHLFDAILHWNNRLANPAGEVLRYFYQQPNSKTVLSRYFFGATFTPQQKVTAQQWMKD
ncbi:MAG: M1 family metallopeptidase [Bacteroidetes bacterium]|nr:M1 family metallopeptidase [Bacteroidota bacterium]